MQELISKLAVVGLQVRQIYFVHQEACRSTHWRSLLSDARNKMIELRKKKTEATCAVHGRYLRAAFASFSPKSMAFSVPTSSDCEEQLALSS